MNGNETQQPQMTEEQVREYLEQVRSAPAEQVITDVVGVVLNAASAKVGRNDGRLLIDLAAVVLDHTRPHLSSDFATQVDQVLGQLRLGQVQAEQTAKDEPNDITGKPATPRRQVAEPEQPVTPKLWIPGRD